MILATSARNAAVAAVVALIDAGSGAGYLEFQTSGAAEVATCPFSDPAFGAPSTGTATANAISSDTNATGGTTTQAVAKDSDANAVATFTVGTSGTEIVLTSNVIGAGDTVSMDSLTVTQPAS